jgi:FkbM family methyltransferase
MNEYIKYWDEKIVERHVGQDIGYAIQYFKELNQTNISIIDIGANVGKIYDCLQRHFTIEKVVMVEASKQLCDYMIEKYKDKKNIIIYNFAISDVSGNFRLWEGSFENLNKFSEEINLGLSKLENTAGSTVCYTMDYFLNNYNTLQPEEISLIKIDTETKDLFILKDLTNWLAEKKIQPFILFENNYHNSMTLEEAQTIINNFCILCKYELINLATSPGDCFLKPIISK